MRPTSFALWNGIADLLAIISLTKGLLEGSNRRAIEMKEWLDSVESELAEMLIAVIDGDFDDLSVTIDHWALAGLESALDQRPDYSRTRARFPTSMLAFWTDEVHRRGWELINLAMGTISIMDSCQVYRCLEELRYPIK